MRDHWTRIVSERLAGLDLPDDERDDVIEEVAAHLRECAEELEGAGAADAAERTLAQVSDWTRLAAKIRRAKEERMTATGTDGARGLTRQAHRRRLMAAVVTAAVLLGAAAGLVTSWLTPLRYRSTAVLAVASADTSGGVAARIQDIQQRVLSRIRLEQVIADFHLYSAERASKVMEEVVDQFRGDISLQVERPDAISVRYTGSNPTVAMRVTETLAAYLKDESLVEAERSGQSGLFTLLDPARVPDQPLGPTRLQRIGFGAAAGLAAGLLIALVLAFARFPSGGRPQPQTA